MSANSSIEWTDHTFNPVWGCVEVSPACKDCYAKAWDKRVGGAHWGPHAPLREFGDAHWNEPLKWDRDAERDGVRRRVFCASMADVFDNRWPDYIRPRLWDLIARTHHLDWMLLTKRPQNIKAMLPKDWNGGWGKVWLGVTAENQQEADRRIPILLGIPAAVRFISAEPLLGPLNLEPFLWRPMALSEIPGWALNDGCSAGVARRKLLHWVIAGGERGKRPPHPDWFRSLRDQCGEAGASFLFKQWGDWAPPEVVPAIHWKGRHQYVGDQYMMKVGKKAAGRLLDGREHNEYPSTTREATCQSAS